MNSMFIAGGDYYGAGDWGYTSLLNIVTFGEKFDTSGVTDMHSMFSGCSRLTDLDLSNFNTPKVTSMRNMFSSCSSLTTLDMRNADFSKATFESWEGMFYGVPSTITVTVKDSAAETFIRNRLDNDISTGAGTVTIA